MSALNLISPRCRLLLPGLTLVALLAARPLPATTDLRQELAGAARGIAKLLQGRGEDTIAVGQFSGPPNLPTSAGPGIAQILTEELRKLGITPKRRAKLGIKGEYLVTEVPAPESPALKLLAIKLKGTVVDSLGNVISDFDFERTVPGEATFLQLTGLPVVLPDGSREERDQKLRASLSEPRTHLVGSRIAAAPESPYAIEVLVNGQPRTPRDDDGLAFVEIRRGETYAVRLINDSDQDAAVTLTIDGLSLFAFSEERIRWGPHRGEPRSSVVIVAPHGRSVIRGWYRTDEQTDLFLLTEYARSAAAAVNLTTEEVGTITASFAAAWVPRTTKPVPRTAGPASAPPPPPRSPAPEPTAAPEPAAEPTAPSAPRSSVLAQPSGTGSGSVGSGTPERAALPSDATGFGQRVAERYARVERIIGPIRASVSVRYAK